MEYNRRTLAFGTVYKFIFTECGGDNGRLEKVDVCTKSRIFL
jgi:hypothetical protein